MERNNLPFIDGDICFLPEQISPKEVNKDAQNFINLNKKKIIGEIGTINGVFDFLQKIQSRYTLKPQDFFFKSLPKKVQRYVATNTAIMSEDPFSIVPILPYTDWGYIILENGPIADTFKFLELQRLFSIRQLGFLMNPVLRDIRLNEPALGFDHTRGLHSLDVAVILRLIALNNPDFNLDKNLLSVGGASHDALTPAGSDTTKLVDLELFDEDLHYEEIFQRTGWPKLKSMYKLNESSMKAMILNQGLYGQLLDIADKIAYTSRDVWKFVGVYGEIEIPRSKEYLRLKELVDSYPKFCNLLEDVKIINGQIAFVDGFRLGIHLTIRALMYKELYYNPSSRFLEYKFSKRVIDRLFKEKIISRNLLLTWRDSQLEEKIWEFMGNRYFPSCFEQSTYLNFNSEKKRSNYLKKSRSEKTKLIIPDDFKCVTKTGVSKYFVKQDKDLIVFKDAYPKMAKEIEDIMTWQQRFGVYVISFDDLNIPKEKRQSLKEKMEKM